MFHFLNKTSTIVLFVCIVEILIFSIPVATGIEKINISTIHTKSTIVDVLFRKWNTSYNKLPKGVYIIDGKKVLKTE